MGPSFIESGRWIRAGEDVALRIRVGDPRQSLPGGVAVEPGVTALLLAPGGGGQRLAPGDYGLEALLALPALSGGDLVLVQAKPLACPFELREVAGKHGGSATLSFTLAVEIASVPKLVTSLLPEPGRLVQENLGERLHADVRSAADAVLGREDLTPDLPSARVAAMLEGALASVGAAAGLRVTRVDDVQIEVAGAAAVAESRAYGEVALDDGGGPAPELESRAPGARDASPERDFALEGISAEALALGEGADTPERSVPLPRSAPSAIDVEAEPEAVRCTGCGTLQRKTKGICGLCTTPFG